ncbi:MAG: hypothetical protein ACREDO_00450 [Methyloceanibacter sp.]
MTVSKLTLLGTSALFALGLGLAPASAQDAAAEEEAYTPSGMAAAIGSAVEDADPTDRDKPTPEYTGSGMAAAIGSDIEEATPVDASEPPEPYAGSGMATAIGSDVEEPPGPDDVPKRLRRAGVEDIEQYKQSKSALR